ncbi:unnamed protein product [Arabidopsis lyrata]|nr:unnamed protein product [Arabidopsis lyrata]
MEVFVSIHWSRSGAMTPPITISERVRPPQSSRKPTFPLCKIDGHQPKVGTNNVKLLPIILDRCARHPCSSLIGRNPL